jgi:hypothetical protein
LLAQFFQFPGKAGKLRKRLGNVETGSSPRTVTIPVSEPTIVTHADGSRSATIAPLIDSQFDFQRFRRAIYHIAFNAYAFQRGADAALHEQFDPVRNYIRKPKSKESWLFAQYVNLGASFNRDVTVMLDGNESAEFVGITICAGAAFGVDLLASGQLPEWVRRQFPPTTDIIGPDHRVARAQRHSKSEPRYQVTIYLDE